MTRPSNPFRSACLAIALGATATPLQAAPDAWTFDAASAAIAAQSCPDGATDTPFKPMPLTITPVPVSDATLPNDVRFSGSWHLTSTDSDLGGLSGLTLMENGDLLAVSDVGLFMRIGLTDGAPDGRASKAPMRFENPLVRPGKLTADAEGLDWRDGLALVSFERNFRVLGFALDRCGAKARGIRIATPPKRYGKRPIRANSGPEALMLDREGRMQIGYEQPRSERMVTGTVLSDGDVVLSDPTTDPYLEPDFRLVGLDHLDLHTGQEVAVRLLRAYDRERKNRSILHFDGDLPLPAITLQGPLTLDNFEGIVLTEIPTGIRLYMIADDNFSSRQKTLLYALDIDLPLSGQP